MADRSARKSARSSKAPNVIKLVMPDTKTPSQRLKNAYQLLKEEEIEPLEWVTETVCMEMTTRTKSTYFVVDPFEGDAYENLRSLKCFVVGAQVMVQCVKESITIPRCEYPILHMALRNAVISLSGIREGERDEMYRKIQLMNGRVEKSLTLDVTHLVSLTTGASSKKYIVAAEKGIPILSPKWLNFCWETGKNEPIDGTADDILAKFRCPLFEGMKFCASGYDLTDRNYIKDTVIAEGGTYSGEMRLQNCSHLIVKEPTGPKFQCAQKWKIRCIRIEWIRESMAKGFCQDENNYVVEGDGNGGSTSTPERKKVQDRVSTSSLAGSGAPRFSVSSDISIIDQSHVNETMWNSTVMSSSTGSSLPIGPKKSHALDIVNVAELTRGKKALFLDGCKIFVHGMQSHHADKCVKLINSGGAARFSALNENVTHVILDRSGGEACRAESDFFQLLETKGWTPLVVSPEWLIESARQGKSVPEAPYLRNSNQKPSNEGEREKDFLKPRLPPPPSTTGTGGGKVSTKPSVSDIPEGADAVFEELDDDDDIMTQYGSQKPAAADDEKTIMEGPPSAGATNGDFDTFDDVTACEKIAVAAASDAAPSALQNRPEAYTPVNERGSEPLAPEAEDAAIEPRPTAEKPDVTTAKSDVTALQDNKASTDGTTTTTTMAGEESESQFDSQESMVLEVFKNLRIALLGFSDEEVGELTEMIEASLGTVVTSTPTTLKGPEADYLIVPIQGVPPGAEYIHAKQTTTSVWVMLCLESQVLLPIASNPMFAPFDLDEDDLPLQDCVITITGYSGCERENISHLAGLLGAHSQELFVRKTKAGKQANNTKPNTHLICQSASGQKYDAAKKWNIPAVSARWLYACARKKRLLPPGKFDIDKETDETTMATTLASTMASATTNDATTLPKPKGESAADVEPAPSETDADETFALNNLPPSIHPPIGRLNSTQQVETATPTLLRSKSLTSAAADTKPTTPVSMAPSTSAGSISSTPGGGGGTPSAHHPRVAHLRRDSIRRDGGGGGGVGGSSSKDDLSTTPNGNVGVVEKRRQSGAVTPARFMDPNNSYHPDFDVEDFLDELKTPEPPSTISPTTGQVRKHARKDSVPLDVLYDEAMKEAIANTQGTPDWKKNQDAEPFKASQTPGGMLATKPPPLQGVIIAVSKKLSHMQEQLNSLALDLGAEYRWTFDVSCTHFIYQGKSTDSNKEIKTARNLAKFIVCPEWLYQCLEADGRLDEDQFPYTFDGKKNLGGLITKTASSASPVVTTTRTTRNNGAAAAAANKNNAETTSRAVEEKIVNDNKKLAEEKENEEDERTKESLAFERCAAFIESSKERRQSLLRSRNDSVSGNASPMSDSGAPSTTTTPVQRASSKNLKQQQQQQPPRKSPPTYEGSMPMGIGWEDPTEKAEREKMASKIRDVCQQTQGFAVAGAVIPAAATSSEDTFGDSIGDSILAAVGNATKSKKDDLSADAGGNGGKLEERPRETADVLEEMAEETLEDESSGTNTEDDEEKKVFQFSGLSPEEKMEMKTALDVLGGVMLESSNFEYECTHLIVKQPARNEKFLACVASGRWVVSMSYIEKCLEAGEFLPEEDYEWGSPSNQHPALSTLPEMARRLSGSAHKWRKILHERRRQRPNEEQGAFIEEPYGRWKVLLISDKSKEPGLTRLLQAGGGEIIASALPFTDDIMHAATHALLDERRLGENKDVILGLLKSLNVKVYKPEYIPAFLQGADDLESFSLLNGGKRKAESTSGAETSGAPNSKRGRLSTKS